MPKFDCKRLTSDSPLFQVETRHLRYDQRHPLLYKQMQALLKKQKQQTKDGQYFGQVRSETQKKAEWGRFIHSAEAQAKANEAEQEKEVIQHFMVNIPSSAKEPDAETRRRVLGSVFHVFDAKKDVAEVFWQAEPLLQHGGAFENMGAFVDGLLKETGRDNVESDPVDPDGYRQFGRIFTPEGDEQVLTVKGLRIFSFKQKIDDETSVLHFLLPLEDGEQHDQVDRPSHLLPYINGRADDAYDITNALSRTLYVLVKAHLDELLTYVMKRSPMIIGAKEAGLPLIEHDKEYLKTREHIQTRRALLPKQVTNPTELAEIIDGEYLLNRYNELPLAQNGGPPEEDLHLYSLHHNLYLPLEANLVSRLHSAMSRVETEPFQPELNLDGLDALIKAFTLAKESPQCKPRDVPLTKDALQGLIIKEGLAAGLVTLDKVLALSPSEEYDSESKSSGGKSDSSSSDTMSVEVRRAECTMLNCEPEDVWHAKTTYKAALQRAREEPERDPEVDASHQAMHLEGYVLESLWTKLRVCQ